MVGVNKIELRPIHYASLSGGKDSLYMLGLILANQDKYPLDMVVNFDLEIEWEISKKVVSYIENKCKEANIKFVRIKPRKSWDELFSKYGFPIHSAKWCNSMYKLDCKRQLNKWIAEQNCRPIAYIGFCADETKRFKYDLGDWEKQDICYPLAEEGIEEKQILEWARKQPIFEGYYDYLDRMGCKACPMARMIEWAYLLYKEPEYYAKAIEQLKETKEMLNKKSVDFVFKGYSPEEFDKIIRSKWLEKLKDNYSFQQLNIFDFLEE